LELGGGAENPGTAVFSHREQSEGYVLLDLLISPETQKQKQRY
jgi:hypothetical protein